MKKLCNHPKLVYDMLTGRDSEESAAAGGFAGCQALFDPWICEGGRGGGKGRFVQGWENLGGKFAVLAKMLELLRRDTNDRSLPTPCRWIDPFPYIASA